MDMSDAGTDQIRLHAFLTNVVRRFGLKLSLFITAVPLLNCATANVRTDRDLDQIRDEVMAMNLKPADFNAAGGHYNVVLRDKPIIPDRRVGSIQPKNDVLQLSDNIDQWNDLTVLARVKVDKDYRGSKGGVWNYWVVVRQQVNGQPRYRSVFVSQDGKYRDWGEGFGRVKSTHPHTYPRAYWIKNSDARGWSNCGGYCCCDDGTCRSPTTEEFEQAD